MGAAGVSLVSALRLASGEAVLVQRGWLAAAGSRSAHPQAAADPGAELTGGALPPQRSPHPTPWGAPPSPAAPPRVWAAPAPAAARKSRRPTPTAGVARRLAAAIRRIPRDLAAFHP